MLRTLIRAEAYLRKTSIIKLFATVVSVTYVWRDGKYASGTPNLHQKN